MGGENMNYKHGQKLSTFTEALRALADGEQIIDQLGTIWSCGELFHKTVGIRKHSVHTLSFLQWPMTIHRPKEEKKKVKRWQWIGYCEENKAFGTTAFLSEEEAQRAQKEKGLNIIRKIPESEKEI